MFWKRIKTTKCPFDITYHYHKPESRKLIIYNKANKTIRNVDICVYNGSNRELKQSIDEITHKTSVLIDCTNLLTPDSITQSNDIKRVEISLASKKYTFKPEPDGKFLLC